jgi:hypothetical protein
MYELNADGERIRVEQKRPQEPPANKETRRQFSWTVITGVIDHKTITENLARAGIEQAAEPPSHAAGMRPEVNPRSGIAPPARAGWAYRRVDLERQVRKPDGSWSSWAAVSPQVNLTILDNIPEQEEELVAEEFRLSTLVDPLPFLIDGRWQGVNHPSFVSTPRRLIEKFLVREPARPGDAAEFQVPELMSRTFDFTVSPGRTYRYRAHLVLAVHKRPSRPFYSFGEWSSRTNAVRVP